MRTESDKTYKRTVEKIGIPPCLRGTMSKINMISLNEMPLKYVKKRFERSHGDKSGDDNNERLYDNFVEYLSTMT